MTSSVNSSRQNLGPLFIILALSTLALVQSRSIPEQNDVELGLNSPFARSDSRRATASHDDLNYYSALVAFGASYTDNAHPRDAIYNATVRNYYPYSLYGGRYTNGLIQVEYMVDPTTRPALRTERSATVALFDYAYGGSVIRNGLTGTGSNERPDTNQQEALDLNQKVRQYFRALDRGSIKLDNGRVLHFFNSGINPVTSIWLQTLAGNMTVRSASSAVTTNVQVYGQYISSIDTYASVEKKVKAADYLIVNIPPMDLLPTFGYQVPTNYSVSQKKEAITLLRNLSDQFNSELFAFTTKFRSQVREGNKVFFYDLAALWKKLYTSPKSFRITVPVPTPCYNSTTNITCSDPQHYLFWDTLHPVTTVHKIWAIEMNELVNAA